MNSSLPGVQDDPFQLARFLLAQEDSYAAALSELRRGRKTSHWMWYIFPQLAGLGSSFAARQYAIRSVGEARAYLDHPTLGPRLLQCCQAVLSVMGKSASDILGYPDDLKLRSSMTLFARLTGAPRVFQEVLEKYYDGKPDDRTLELLKE